MLVGIGCGHLEAQARGTVRTEENVRAEPQGTIIGRVEVGTVLPILQIQGRWLQIELQGWIWTQSIQTSDRQGFDGRVSAAPEENLRAEPSGRVMARLLEGALLDRVEEIPGWTRVRRVAWVWAPSVETEEAGLSGGAGTPPSPGAEPLEGSWFRAGPSGAVILTGPDGDTLARGRPGAQLQLLARQGSWSRVRLEGWVWIPSMEDSSSVASGVLSELTPEEVVQDPEAARGQVVSWELQFVSLEEAERVRTDFYEGEPFLLTRTTSSDRAFVYVAIPPERLGEVEGLVPLERIRVVGRIRTGAAALTGNPVLDLLELVRDSSGW
jgi:hypothetical protein